MPWAEKDAKRHTKKASTPKKQEMWSNIANRMLDQTGDEAKAIRVANGVLKKRAKRSY